MPCGDQNSIEDTDVINEQWLTIVIVIMLIISSLNIFNILILKCDMIIKIWQLIYILLCDSYGKQI